MTEAQFISRFLEGLAAPLRSQAVERPTGARSLRSFRPPRESNLTPNHMTHSAP